MCAAKTVGADFDFLSPSLRSCINLGKTEPCVKKAIQVLKRLKDQIKVEQPADRHSNPMHSTVAATVALQGLCIEGRATGSLRSHEETMEGGLDWNATIKQILDLVVRMETDRQETLEKLSEEKEKVHHLGQKLDVESKRRLCVIESAVQGEYECSVDELKKLHSVVEKERRELSAVLCDLSVTASKHSQMKKEEAELARNRLLLGEKISDEKQKIDQIEQLHKETLDKVVIAKKALTEMEQKLLLSRKKADAERREREHKLAASRRKLRKAEEEVKDAVEEKRMLQTNVLRFQQDIEEANKKELEWEDCASKKLSDFKDVHSEVCALQDVYSQLAMKNKQADNRNRSLEAEWQKECEALEGQNCGHMDALEQTKHQMLELKDKREELEQENDRIKEEISLCKRQQEDDKKTIERGNSELQRLEKQLDVSHVEFSKLQRLNHELLQRLEELKAQTGSEEYKQKMNIETLQKTIRDNDVANRKLELQEKESKDECEKLVMEVEAMTEKLKSSIKCDTAKQEALNEEIKELEMACADQEKAVDHLQMKLFTVSNSYESARDTIGVEVEKLERTSLQFQNDLERKMKKYDELRTHEGLLQGRVEELDKNIASTHKLKSEVEAENRELQKTVDELSDQFDGEKEDEYSFEQELNDIIEFREEAQKRFVLYREQREQELQLLKTNLHSSMTHNALIRKQYECVQGEYLALKSKMLDELEKNEDTTVTNTDMQELECVQSHLSFYLRNYLEHRSSAFTNKLTSCQKLAEGNLTSLLLLHSDARKIEN